MINSTNVIWTTFYPVLPEILLLMLGFGVMGLDLFGGKNRSLMPWCTALGALMVLAAVIMHPVISGFEGMILSDSYAMFFKVICLAGLIMTALLSDHYCRAHMVNQGEYYFLLIFATVGMMIMASAGDLLVLYLGLELMALSVYCLIGMLKRDQRSSEAAVKYFLMGAFASAILLYGMALVYGLTGTTSIATIAELTASGAVLQSPALFAALTLLMAAFCFKVAAAPFHFWTPDVYEGAPTTVTAFMSVAPKAASFAVLGRVMVEVFPLLHDYWGGLLAILALLTMAVGNITALAQTSIKRMLAYSAIAHAGYALLGILAGTPEGLSATMGYLFIYAFMTMGAFAVLVLLAEKEADRETLDDYKGLAKTNPLAAMLMLLFMFSLIGIPPTAGFIGKFYVLKAALGAGYLLTVIGAVIFSAISAYYYLRVVRYMYMHEPAEPVKLRYSPAISVVLGLSLLGVVGLGLFPDFLIDQAASALFGR
ncbi:MAG: NADH-quinone oxidoreductase subunit N [Desulfurivibrio sp.]